MFPLRATPAATRAASALYFLCRKSSMPPHMMIWIIAALAAAGVIFRPFHWPEAIWAVSGAVLLVALGLLPVSDALIGVGKGAGRLPISHRDDVAIRDCASGGIVRLVGGGGDETGKRLG